MTFTACSQVQWRDDGEGFQESSADAAIGDLIWDPKSGTGHVLVGMSEPVVFGWEKPWRYHVCECGLLDILDHHNYILDRRHS